MGRTQPRTQGLFFAGWFLITCGIVEGGPFTNKRWLARWEVDGIVSFPSAKKTLNLKILFL